MSNNKKHIIPTELLIRYFADEVTSQERIEIEAWRDTDEQNRKEFLTIQKIWNTSEGTSKLEDIDIEKEWKIMKKKAGIDEVKVITLKYVLQIAASIIIISGIGTWLILKTSTITQSSEIAVVKDIELPDGSVIKLNSDSKISYEKGFGQDHRNISLKGEAYFKVKPDKEHLFIIKTGNASIEVVGTEFNVNAYSDELEVKVVVKEGKVKLYDHKKPDKEIILSGGQAGSFNKNRKYLSKEPVFNPNEIAWVTRMIEFYDTRLTEVGSILQNTYHKSFIISDKVKNCPITVTFENLELEQVLKILESTLDLEISEDNDKIYVSGKGC